MNKLSLILSAVVMIAMLVVIAPGILAINRGKALRNIAIWLGIFAALGLFYQNFGPGSAHPLFSVPQGMQRTPEPVQPIQLSAPPPEETKPEIKPDGKTDGSKQDNEPSFTPPAE